MQFADIHGYDHFKSDLIRLTRTNHLPHAVLFEIQDGYPALHIAWAWAQYINCQHATEQDSCGVCPSCKKTASIAHPDILYIYPVVNAAQAEVPSEIYYDQWRSFLTSSPYVSSQDWLEALNAGNSQPVIYVNEISHLIERLGITSAESGWRIIIIYQPERMNESAANKLLKSLEEPPARTLFILVSAHTDQLLDTILSRVQQFELPPMTDPDMRAAIRQVLPDTPEDQITQTIALAEGNIGEAIATIQSSEHRERLDDFLNRWSDCTNRKSLLGLKALSEEIADTGRESVVSFIKSLTHYLHLLWRQSLNGTAQSTQGLRISHKHLGQCYGLTERAIHDVRGNVMSKVVLFDTFLQMLKIFA